MFYLEESQKYFMQQSQAQIEKKFLVYLLGWAYYLLVLVPPYLHNYPYTYTTPVGRIKRIFALKSCNKYEIKLSYVSWVNRNIF